MMIKAIIKELKDIQIKNNIKILFAVEAGSRVWGLESDDSDYDVRFVFVRDEKDYLRINKLKDVLTVTIGDRDYVGFDIYKFIKLFLSSNPCTLEWVQSDIIYIDDEKTKEFLLNFIKKRFNIASLYYHYKSMCKQNYLKYLKSGELMTYKKYLYSMRGLANARWVKQTNTLPPIKFMKVLTGNVKMIDEAVITKLLNIIKLKKDSKENDRVGNIILLDEYIENFLKEEDDIKNNRIIDFADVQEYVYKLILNKRKK